MTTNPDKLADIFEICLSQLESGMNMDEVLKNAGDFEEEIRPLLETAGKTIDDEPIPAAVIHRSRTRLLGQAQQLRSIKPARPRISFKKYRFVMRLMVLILVAGVSLTSLFAVSAQAVPGDNLYNIKRLGESARLSIALPGSRGELEKTFQLRRIGEIKELLALGRPAPVAFEAIVTEIDDRAWQVGGLAVEITENTEIVGEIETGMFVEVIGRTTPDGKLFAAKIYLRAYAFVGTVENITGPIWTINGTPIRIRAESQLSQGISIGTKVIVLASVDNEGNISARAILVTDDSQQLQEENLLDLAIPTEAISNPTATATPSPTATETEDIEFEPTEDEEEDRSGSNSDDTKTPEPTDDSDKTEEPDETDEPEETETPKPTKTEDPDDD